jgi:predicted HTH transcriptional regulator
MIIDECIKIGHPTPVYSQDPVGTLLTLIPKSQIGGSTQAQVLNSDPRFEKLTEQQILIIVCLQKKGKLSPKEIMSRAPEIHERTLRRDLNRLKDLGYADYIGETTSRRWYSLV